MGHREVWDYLGDEWAIFYYRLWSARKFILRRVDTYRILDRSLVEQSITFDIDKDELSDLIDGSSLPNGGKEILYLPLANFQREQFLDVDCRDSGGGVMHLARRVTNEGVSSHILMGCLLQECTLPSGDSQLFGLLRKQIGFQGDVVDSFVESVRELVSVRNGGGPVAWSHGWKEFENLLSGFESRYIQSLPINISGGGVEVVKIRLRKEYDRVGVSAGIMQNVGVVASGSDGDAGPGRLRWKDCTEQLKDFTYMACRKIEKFDRNLKFSVRRTFHELISALGLVSAEIGIANIALGVGHAPVHLRFIAPSGFNIDDVKVYRSEGGASIESTWGGRQFFSEYLSVRFHHERVSLQDHGVRPGRYSLIMVLNQKRNSFLIPIASISTILFGILMLAYGAGAEGVFSNEAAIGGALFIFPSLVAVFLVREREHEQLSINLGWSRVLVALLLVMCIGVGVLISLCSKDQQKGVGSLWSLSVSVTALYAGLLSFILWHQVVRISAMRRLVLSRWRLCVSDHLGRPARGIPESIAQTVHARLERDRRIVLGVGWVSCAVFWIYAYWLSSTLSLPDVRDQVSLGGFVLVFIWFVLFCSADR